MKREIKEVLGVKLEVCFTEWHMHMIQSIYDLLSYINAGIHIYTSYPTVALLLGYESLLKELGIYLEKCDKHRYLLLADKGTLGYLLRIMFHRDCKEALKTFACSPVSSFNYLGYNKEDVKKLLKICWDYSVFLGIAEDHGNRTFLFERTDEMSEYLEGIGYKRTKFLGYLGYIRKGSN